MKKRTLMLTGAALMAGVALLPGISQGAETARFGEGSTAADILKYVRSEGKVARPDTALPPGMVPVDTPPADNVPTERTVILLDTPRPEKPRATSGRPGSSTEGPSRTTSAPPKPRPIKPAAFTPESQTPAAPPSRSNEAATDGAPSTCKAVGAPFTLDVKFAPNSHYVETSAFSLLVEAGKAMKDEFLAGCYFAVEGHTDSTGAFARNLTLSRQRAETVGAFLKALGVDGSRLAISGKGSTESDGLDPANSRRVQFRILDRLPG